ncbi:MAG: hypothetical protein Q4E53_10410 [Eubacteriales bacterium]|nr:hypothetical protein [Eubacteriales bacterium]
MNTTHGHGSTMESIDALFQKRESQYQKMEEMHENRRRQLKEMEESIQIKILELQEMEKRVADRESVCEQRILVLDEREKKLRDQDRSLYEDKRSYEESKKASEIELEHRKEAVRLELAEARYQKELYETKIFELGENGEGLKLQSVSAQKQIQLLQEELEVRKRELEAKQQELELKQEQLVSREEEIQKLHQELFSAKSSQEQNDSKIQDLTEELEEKDNVIKVLKDNCQSVTELQNQKEELIKRCGEQTVHIESLLKENHDLDMRLQESEQRKNELFRKMFGYQSSDEEDEQESIEAPLPILEEEEVDQDIHYKTQKYTDRSVWEKPPIEVLDEEMEIPLTAELLKQYLDKEGVKNQLKHTAMGDMVEILFEKLRIMIGFTEEPFYAIHKKTENSRAVRVAIKNLNASQDEVDFQYDLIEKEVIAQGSFEIHTTAEELMLYMLSVKERYFEEDGE